MPVEFWREVVDRVAAEVPGTLLLAEAFWLLEGYFVRTLGMHRVYNSAFMHMLRDEDGAGYRKVIKDTIEFDPEILKRYVNFMSNPDEKTAIEQFGKGDKYFGVATVLATLPGLPMLGHGQVQGFGEKYGMEFRRAMLDEQPDPWLVERHEREIFPLLHRRAWFAEARRLPAVRLRDRRRRGRRGRPRLLERAAAASARWSSTTTGSRRHAGRIRDSAAVRAQGRRTARSGSSAGRWPRASACRTTRRVRASSATRGPGLEYLRSCREIWERGLDVSLDAYGGHVFWEFREVRDGAAGQWARLAARLGGRRRAVARRRAARAPARAGPRAAPGALRRRASSSGVLDGEPHRRARRPRAPARGVPGGRRRGDGAAMSRRPGGHVGGPSAIRGARRGGRGAARRRSLDRSATPLDRRRPLLDLARAVADRRAGARVDVGGDEPRLVRRAAAARRRSLAGLHEAGLDEGEAWAVADRVRVLLALPRPSTSRGPRAHARTRGCSSVAGQRPDPDRDRAQHLGGRRVPRPRRFAAMLGWAVRLDAIERDEARRRSRPRCRGGDRVPRPAAGTPSRRSGRRWLPRSPRPAVGQHGAPARPRVRSRVDATARSAPGAEAAAAEARPGRLSRAGSAGAATSAASPWAMTDSRCGR